MLTATDLVQLERGLRAENVLSVYIDGTETDPARASEWRTRIEDEIDRIRSIVANSSRTERVAFAESVRALERTLGTAGNSVGAAGFALFITQDGVWRAEALPVAIATGVRWGLGAWLGPALRAVKAARPAIVAIVDSRTARLFRYQNGVVERLETLRSHTHIEPPLHMGEPPKQGFHGGTRGRTGTDAVSRERRAARARLMRDVAERVARHAAGDGWILFGGTSGPAHEALAALPATLARRAMVMPELHVRSTVPEIGALAGHGAATLRRSADLASVRGALERAGGRGRASVRMEPTRAALDATAVRSLFLTRRFLDDHREDGEELVRRAIGQHASIELVSGDAAELLDSAGEGIGALLRYPAHDAAEAISRSVSAARDEVAAS